VRTIVVIPDSFKGTMSSIDVCTIVERAFTRVLPNVRVVSLPVADGGEGTVDAFLAAVGGRKVPVTATGPAGDPVPSFYGLTSSGLAIVEMAAAAGLPLVDGPLTPGLTTTFGVGELILAALDAGAQHLVVGLGGSATTDLGTGAAAALGVRFYDAAGEEFVPVSGNLDRIASIDASGVDPRIAAVGMTVMCDIDNPLYGPRGAAYVFGPQKGADPGQVADLDAGLRHAAAIIEHDLGVSVADRPGAGAAGGMGAGLVAFCGAELAPGIDVVLRAARFDEIVRQADLVITGEGALDEQSLSGKVVVGVARRAHAVGVPVVAVAGDLRDGYEPAYAEGLTAAFSINHLAIPYPDAKARARKDLADWVDNFARTLRLTGWA